MYAIKVDIYISLYIEVHLVYTMYRAVSANTRCSSNVVLMLGQRHRRWPNIRTSLDKHLMTAGVQKIDILE